MFDKYKIKTCDDLLSYLSKNLNYGFVANKIIHKDTDNDFSQKMNKLYQIRLGEDLIKTGYGVCWDFCELERLFFEEKNIPHRCFFIKSNLKNNLGPTHSFLIYKEKKNYYWFEFSWQKYKGIHQYLSIKEAINDILKKFIQYYNNLEIQNIDIYLIPKITKRLHSSEYIKLCLSSKKINL